MIRTVAPAAQIRGILIPPGDKSISHRALILSAIASGVSHLTGVSTGLDVDATIRCLRELGVRIEAEGGTVDVHGVGMRGLKTPAGELDAANSGTTMRLLAGLLAGQEMEVVIDGDDSLRRRPMERVAEPLRQLGATIDTMRGGTAPIRVTGGHLTAIDYVLPVASAQVKSAVLLAALYAEGRTVVGERVATRNHTEIALLEMGCDLVAFHGTCSLDGPVKRLRPRSLAVPGDPSAAAFWLAAAAAHPDAELTIRDIGLNPSRTGYFSVLQAMGASFEIERHPLNGGEAVGEVRVASSPMGGIAIGPELVPHLIDELPVIAVIATQAAGLTRITGAEELRHKESDRIAVVVRQLKRLGASVRELRDGMEIEGPTPLTGGEVDSEGDHRVAMALAVAGLLAEAPVVISRAESVDVSYPRFWEDLDRLTAGG